MFNEKIIIKDNMLIVSHVYGYYYIFVLVVNFDFLNCNK